MDLDDAFYERALRRVGRFMGVAAGAGAVAAFALGGWRAGAGFAAGAAASWLGFSWLHQAVEALGPAARPPRKWVLALLALRWALLGAGGYVIVKVFGMNAIALAGGLFVPVAAVLLEIVYELIRCRNTNSG